MPNIAYQGSITPKFLSNGPVTSRRCTDVFCCALFVVFWFGMFSIGQYALREGHPQAYLAPYDQFGKFIMMNLLILILKKEIHVEKVRLQNTLIYISLKMKGAFLFRIIQFVWLNAQMKRVRQSHARRIIMGKEAIVEILKPIPLSHVIISLWFVKFLMFFLRLWSILFTKNIKDVCRSLQHKCAKFQLSVRSYGRS